MYENHFGMNRQPFAAPPQLSTYFPAASHEEALATLRYAVTQGRGIGLIVGAPGIGKTIVCQRLMTILDPTFATAMVTNTNMTTVKGLLQAILYDLTLPYHSMDEQELRLTLTDFLLGKYAAGQRTVLLVDEAQNLSAPLLEELRMLSNLEGETGKVVQIVLAGQPRLAATLRQPELETLNQRVGARAVLQPLTPEETADYIRHQLLCVGAAADIFTDDAMAAIYEATSGVPRLINQLCERALLVAYVAESPNVDARAIEEAAVNLDDEPAGLDETPTADEAPIADDPTETLEIREAEDATPALRPLAAKVAQAEPLVCCANAAPGMCQQIVLERPAAVFVATGDELLTCSRPPAKTRDRREAAIADSIDRLDERFVQEEVVIDRYAMMDAARGRRRLKDQWTAPQSKTAPAATPSAERLRRPHEVVQSPLSADSPVEMPAGPAEFVQPSDNPAVHEVGAGVADATEPNSSQPVLVIENRPTRVGGHIVRQDVPQPTPRGPGSYRRLFTRARRSRSL